MKKRRFLVLADFKSISLNRVCGEGRGVYQLSFALERSLDWYDFLLLTITYPSTPQLSSSVKMHILAMLIIVALNSACYELTVDIESDSVHSETSFQGEQQQRAGGGGGGVGSVRNEQTWAPAFFYFLHILLVSLPSCWIKSFTSSTLSIIMLSAALLENWAPRICGLQYLWTMCSSIHLKALYKSGKGLLSSFHRRGDQGTERSIQWLAQDCTVSQWPNQT